MKKYIYSNRKEIEMKNANQTNVNQIDNIIMKETKFTKIKDCINNSNDNKQDSIIMKKQSNIKNYAFVEIIHRKERTNKNKNLIEEKSKRKNDSINDKLSKRMISRNNNENINNNNKNENISINNNFNNKKNKNENNNINNIKLSNTIVATKTNKRLK